MSSTTFNCLESLSNEVLLEIFEYLDAYDLCQSFYDLNTRINTVLQLVHLHILYDPSKNDATIWNTLASFFNPSQIRILSLHNDINIHERILTAPKENLHSVCLKNMNKDNIYKLIQHFPKHNRIKCFSVTEPWNYSRSHGNSMIHLLLVEHGHRFTSLVNLSLWCATHRIDFPSVSVIFPQLRRLLINNCDFTSNFLGFLRNNTPNLRSLRCLQSYYASVTLTDIVIPNIRELHIYEPSEMGHLQNIFSIFPCLRRLHTDRRLNHSSAAIGASAWQWLIENRLPDLKQLTINLDDGVSQEAVKTFYNGDFWLRKKIIMKLKINKTSGSNPLVTTIYFGRQWSFQYFDNL
ncbi:unnamed protein product [Adineta steineri]|uniref:F-box/LRR-repeat protein 15/At3g58940/PEG3-like LRR domain-containing protein n=1 Tax=Adineta steineri TaxID=433720 RepID=A0A814V0Y9_9BILA|nr:unnamed protein product [Adineta steineri]CAF1182538.1 unnamed protein product [Adineta steineri]